MLTKGYSNNTASLYESELRDFAKSMRGHKWSSITPKDISLYLQQKKANGASSNTIITYISAIRGLYRWMERNYNLEANPSKYIESPKKEKTLPRTVSSISIIRAVESEHNEDIKLAIMIMSSVGLRVSEVRNMKYEDIDMNTSFVRVLGKGKKERLVYLPSYITETIRARGRSEGAIFGKWDDRKFRYAIYIAFERIGVKCSPHMLRHSFAEQAMSKGMRLDVLQKILGHTSMATTQIYLHANNQIVRQEVVKMYQ